MFRRRALPLAQLAAQELQMPHVPHVPRTAVGACQAFATYDVNANGMHLVVLMYADVGTAYSTAVSRHHTYAAVTSVLKTLPWCCTGFLDAAEFGELQADLRLIGPSMCRRYFTADASMSEGTNVAQTQALGGGDHVVLVDWALLCERLRAGVPTLTPTPYVYQRRFCYRLNFIWSPQLLDTNTCAVCGCHRARPNPGSVTRSARAAFRRHRHLQYV